MFALAASLALASATFPPKIEDALGMPCVPSCTLCHATAVGGTGTVIQPFGLAMQQRALVRSDVSTIAPALEVMEADAIDSDEDGVIDVDELREGGNPNPDGVPFCVLAPPVYGCLSHVGAGGGLALAALAGALVSRRRQNRRS